MGKDVGDGDRSEKDVGVFSGKTSRGKWVICGAQGYAGPDELPEALKGADVVIIPAGVPRKPGMTRDDLFKVPPFNFYGQW
jgi:lactate/malate dehydrogenase, NAD binding domain